jgi:hypothetical protein
LAGAARETTTAASEPTPLARCGSLATVDQSMINASIFKFFLLDKTREDIRSTLRRSRRHFLWPTALY